MNRKLFFYILILISSLFFGVAFANIHALTWKGIYYPGIPNQKGISRSYCVEHTIGTFIHSVKDVLVHGITTDRGIKLDHATFHEKKQHGIYLLTGDLIAHGITRNIRWNDHVYYYLYKLSESGITRGIWSTGKCKGLYKGVVVNASNP